MPQEPNQTASLAQKAKWPLFLVANMAILFIVGVSTIRETYRGYTVDKEITTLEQKVKTLEGRKSELSELARKMQSEQFIEREARSKLGLQKPGEHVIILEGVTATSSSWSVDITPQPPQQVVYKSNPVLWWEYFTKPHPDAG
ncbi:MAG: septum formation initiator family protein [Patescibacteria group bacterium]